MLRRASGHFLRRRFHVVLEHAAFEEAHGGLGEARRLCIQACALRPPVLEAFLQHANLERRAGHLLRMQQVYEDAVECLAGDALCYLLRHAASYARRVLSAPGWGADLLESALRREPSSEALWDLRLSHEIETLERGGGAGGAGTRGGADDAAEADEDEDEDEGEGDGGCGATHDDAAAGLTGGLAGGLAGGLTGSKVEAGGQGEPADALRHEVGTPPDRDGQPPPLPPQQQEQQAATSCGALGRANVPAGRADVPAASSSGESAALADGAVPPRVSAAALQRVCALFERALASHSPLGEEAKQLLWRRYVQTVSDHSGSIKRVRALNDRCAAAQAPKRRRGADAAAGAAGGSAVAAPGSAAAAVAAYPPYGGTAAEYASYQQAAYTQYYQYQQAYASYQQAASGYYG